MSHLLPKVEECWNTVTPQEHWKAWLERDARFREEDLVADILKDIINRVTYDIGCGSGRYAHKLDYDYYFGWDIWNSTLEYAREWARLSGLDSAEFYPGGVFNESLKTRIVKPDVVLTLNVMRHFKDPFSGYRWVWDFLPAGCVWVTDFLTAPKDGFIDGDFSAVIPEWEMRAFLRDKIHSEPLNWFHEVGDWQLVRLEK